MEQERDVLAVRTHGNSRFTATQVTRASYASGRSRFRSRLVSESIEMGSEEIWHFLLIHCDALRTGL